MRGTLAALAFAGLLAACSHSGNVAPDSGFAGSGDDAGSAGDAGVPTDPRPDAGLPDAGTPAPDASTPAPDASTPPADGGTTGVQLGACSDGAPYCVVDLTPQAPLAFGLRASDDGRVLYTTGYGTTARYWIYDSRSGNGIALDSFAPRSAPAVDEKLNLLYIQALGEGCTDFEVRVRSADGADRLLGTPPHGNIATGCTSYLATPVAFAGGYAVVESGARSFLHSPGGDWVDLGSLGSGDLTFATGMNASGHVIGEASVTTDDVPPVIHQFLYRGGAMIDLTAAGMPGTAQAIAGDDTVLSEDNHDDGSGDGSIHALLWRDGVTTDLGLHPAFDWIRARSLNDAHDVAGYMQFNAADASPRHALLYSAQDGTVRDLNELIADHRLHLVSAASVSSSGLLAGQAYDLQGRAHAVALLPQKAPGAPGGTSALPADEVLAQGQRAVALALDDSRVYWIHQTGWNSPYGRWEVRSMAKGGGPIAKVGGGTGSSGNLGVDGAFVYLTAVQCAGAQCQRESFNLLRVPKAGGAAEVMGPGQGQIRFDDSAVYVFVSDNDHYFGQVLKYPKAGGPPVVLADNQGGPATGLEIDDSYVYFNHRPSSPTETPALRRVPKAGGAAVKVTDSSAVAMKLSAGALYYREDKNVDRVAPAGGAAQSLRAPVGEGQQTDIDADGSHVYWNEFAYLTPDLPTFTLACLGRMALDGSGATCLEQSLQNYSGVRVDGSRLYFLLDHQVLSRPK